MQWRSDAAGAQWTGTVGYHQADMLLLPIAQGGAGYESEQRSAGSGSNSSNVMLASANHVANSCRYEAPALPISGTEEAPDEPQFHFGPQSYGNWHYAPAAEPQWAPVGAVGAQFDRLDVRTEEGHAGVEPMHSFCTVSTVSADTEYMHGDGWPYNPQCDDNATTALRAPPKVDSPECDRPADLATPQLLQPCAVAGRQRLWAQWSTESGRRLDTAAVGPSPLPDLLQQCDDGEQERSGGGGAKRKAKRPAAAATGAKKAKAKPQALPDHELGRLRKYRAGRKKGAKEGRATGVVYEYNIQAQSDDSDEEKKRKRRAANQEYAKRHRQRKQQKFIQLQEIVKKCAHCWAEWKTIQDKVDGEVGAE